VTAGVGIDPWPSESRVRAAAALADQRSVASGSIRGQEDPASAICESACSRGGLALVETWQLSALSRDSARRLRGPALELLTVI